MSKCRLAENTREERKCSLQQCLYFRLLQSFLSFYMSSKFPRRDLLTNKENSQLHQRQLNQLALHPAVFRQLQVSLFSNDCFSDFFVVQAAAGIQNHYIFPSLIRMLRVLHGPKVLIFVAQESSIEELCRKLIKNCFTYRNILYAQLFVMLHFTNIYANRTKWVATKKC